MRTGRRILPLLAALALLPAAWREAAAHPHNTAPPVDVTFAWGEFEHELTALVDLEKWQIVSWASPPPRHVNLREEVPPSAAVERLARRLTVELDGAPVAPVFRSLVDGGGPNPEVLPRMKLLVAYPTASQRPPSQVRVLWTDFDGIFWENQAQVPLVVGIEGQVDAATLTREEPEFLWHRRPPPAFRTQAPPPAPPAAGPRLSLPALGLALLALALPFVGPWRRAGLVRRLLPSAGALALAGGVLALGVGRVEPPWGRPDPPTAAQARTITIALVQSIYRAFDAPSESRIYDLLAGSVERDLLGDLYGEVYESLRLREQGGAVCRVEDLLPGTVEVDVPTDGGATQFTAEAEWTVKGAVTHWGHTHRRENLYRAHLVLRNDGTSWRIAAVTVLEHKRVDDGKAAAR